MQHCTNFANSNSAFSRIVINSKNSISIAYLILDKIYINRIEDLLSVVLHVQEIMRLVFALIAFDIQYYT